MPNKKHTAVLGASENPSRYSYMAAERLNNAGHPLSLVSIKKGSLFGEEFKDFREKPKLENVDTVTLYVGSQNLDEWGEYILNLNPKRIIFNPGTEHDEIATEAEKRGIEVVEGCTLVMLGSGQF